MPELTVKSTVITHLTQCGLWNEEAETVFEEMLKDDSIPPGITWGSPAAGYPKGVITEVIKLARTRAVKYIDREKPKHFARATLAR